MADDLQAGVCSTNWLSRTSCGLSGTLALPCSATESVSHEIGAAGFRWPSVKSLTAKGRSIDEEMAADNHPVSVSSNICGSVNVQEVHKPGTELMGSPIKLADGVLSSLATRQWPTDGFIGCGTSDESGLQVTLQAENYLNSQPTFRQDHPSINSGHFREDWTTTQDSNTNTQEVNLFGFEDRSNTGEYYAIAADRSFAENGFDINYGSYPPSSMLHAGGSIDQEINPLLNMSSLNYSLNSQTLFPHDFGSSWPLIKPFSSLSSTSVPTPKQQSIANFQFLNDSPLWTSSMKGGKSVKAPIYDEKHKSTDPNSKALSEEIISSDTTRTIKETALKRPRIETPSILPTFKVRKEKLSDRVTALQQLVSPFGKTDTASVLQEAIQYIKFLHEQVNVLSNPYMKTGVQSQQHLQNSDERNDQESTKQDLRSRGLCLVPISTTFAVSTEMTSDLWRPSFGGNYR